MKVWAAHAALLALVAAAGIMVGDYHHRNLSRIMVLAIYATGYNILFGYTGLLSLGHAMFFAAGLYAMGLGVRFIGLDPVTQLLQPFHGFRLQPAIGQLLDAIGDAAFQIAAVEWWRLAGEILLPIFATG